ncbi:hypothetical protein Tsubulata_004237 [Turnera subulata]|uniref:Uncharacterized protein n=1 Tax=Turnera subulata TaxID=218843 RepID=A0A9Q0FXP7_9ROSI|nr:hypothetical protein Tsubulata_004237 [Turnera subulata]
MAETNSKYGCAVLSWADEVEREEEKEEAARAQALQNQRRSNPFGSARPREVVLQEKGIDWRKLDSHLEQSSTKREALPFKENIPEQPASKSINNKVQTNHPAKRLNHKQEDGDLGFKRNQVPPVSLASQNQIPLAFLPLPSYPPRNVVLNSPVVQNISYGLHNVIPGSLNHPRYRQQIAQAEHRSGFNQNRRNIQLGQSGKGNNLRELVDGRQRKESDPDQTKRKFNGQMGSILGRPPVPYNNKVLPLVTGKDDKYKRGNGGLTKQTFDQATNFQQKRRCRFLPERAKSLQSIGEVECDSSRTKGNV